MASMYALAIECSVLTPTDHWQQLHVCQLEQSLVRQEKSVPSSQLDMGALALLLGPVMLLLLAISQESVNVA